MSPPWSTAQCLLKYGYCLLHWPTMHCGSAPPFRRPRGSRAEGRAANLAATLIPFRDLYVPFLTSALLCGITTIIRFVVGPSTLSRAIPPIHLELLIVGALVALLLAGLILSRPGKISGGHMNPAICLAM